MRRMEIGAIAAATLLACSLSTPPLPAAETDGFDGTALTTKLLVIGIDGMRPDAMAAATTPNIDDLIADGAFSASAQTEDLTFSGPAWSTILHGVHRDRHGVISNDYEGNHLDQYPDFLARLELHDAGLNTARLTTWNELHYNQPTGADINLYHNYAHDGDAIVTAWTEEFLLGIHPDHPGVDIDAIFVYLGDVDIAGHVHGFHPTSPGYLAKIEIADGQVGVMLDALRDRPTYDEEDWLVIVVSDHGGAIDGTHPGNTPEKRTIPLIVSGPSASPGTPFPPGRNVDVCKTALAHMGAPVPTDLDGTVFGLAPTSPPPAAFGMNLVFNGDAEFDRGFEGEVPPDQYVAGWWDPGPDQANVIRYDGTGGWPTSTDPGPPERGSNFFAGGAANDVRMAQVIDVAPLSAAIDAGETRYELSAWLGGYLDQEDRATISAYFHDEESRLVGVDVIGPVTAADRLGVTGLQLRDSTSFALPPGTRRITIVYEAIRAVGTITDGYADAIAFLLYPEAGVPLPPPALVSTPAGATEWRFFGDTGPLIDAAFGPAALAYADGDGGATDENDVFGATDGVTVPHIDGRPASYLHFSHRTSPAQGYHVRAGLDEADGEIGRFTMIFDLYVEPSNTDPWLGLANDDPANADDAELFLRPSMPGYFTPTGGSMSGSWRRGEWNRFVFVNDADARHAAALYLNGSVTPEIVVDSVGSMPDGAPDPFWLLTDDTPGETSDAYIANFAFADEVLDPATIALLGGPNAGGIFDPMPPGDLDASGSIGFSDLVILLSTWGSCSGACLADLDGDGQVGFTDLLVLLSLWD